MNQQILIRPKMTQNETFRDNLKSVLGIVSNFPPGKERYFYEAISLQQTGGLYFVYFRSYPSASKDFWDVYNGHSSLG